MSPLLVNFFHRTHTAVVEFKGAGLGSITRAEGLRFVPFSTSTRRGIPIGPFASLAGAIRAVFVSLFEASGTAEAGDTPSYVSLVAIDRTWSARTVALRPMFMRGIPTIRVRCDPVRDPIGRILGRTRLGSLIIEEVPIGLEDGETKHALARALSAEVARLSS
jgi:hypothetical protein